MAAWGGMKITNLGSEALAESIATGTPLIIDRVVLGDGVMPAGTGKEEMTALVNPRFDATIIKRTFNGDGTVTVKARLTSAEITSDLMLTECGMFGHLEGQPELLFHYDYSPTPFPIPAGGGAAYVDQIFELITRIGNAQNVVINITVSGEIRFRFVVDHFTATEGQQAFTLTNTDADGALDVIINGAVDMGFSAAAGTLTLSAPVPAGTDVWVREMRAGVIE